MLTEKGFVRPSFDDIVNGRITTAKQLFGDDIDTSEQGVLGKFIRIGAYDMAQAYELLEAVYFARFPNSAAGQSLDRLLPFAGIHRNPPRAAIHLVELSGTEGFTVPVGFLVSGGNVTFHTVEDVTLTGGKGQVRVECDEFGTVGNVGDINEIVNPDADVSGVVYVALVLAGREEESDYELRKRFKKTVAGAGSATADAITAEVMRVQDVEGCLIVENEAATEDADGRPPHSFECYVLAPESTDYDVAQAIFSKKPLGVKCVGNTSIDVPDAGGSMHTVRFSHTREITVYIRVDIRVSALFESDGAAQVTQNLVGHVDGLKNGENVVLSALYGDIHKVEGVTEVTALTLSADGVTYTPANIVVGNAEVARLSPAHVTVGVAEDG